MPYSSIIFDLDGTLLDTLTDIAESVNSVLALNGFPIHSRDGYADFLGDGLHNLITRSVPADTPKFIIDECCLSFTEIYSKNWKNNGRLYKGIDIMLAKLLEQGVRCTVLSNKPHAFTCMFIDHFFKEGIFEIVFGQREGVEKKPDPAGAIAISEFLKIKPEDILFVGDSDVDIQTGKAAGMGTVGVSWGYRTVAELKKNNADIIVNNPLEIIKYVLSVA